ncbi:MAG TPA: hypothetical protein VFC78_09830 [Tepidisphaeraceae bacterium]|nr:hypothetical protein [Tepidisphaeraceae bacterium]
MSIPSDHDARKYYRVAKQRLVEAELILEKLDRPAAAIYIGGYAVECILKALILVLTPARSRADALRSLKTDYGHSLLRLRDGIRRCGAIIPADVMGNILFATAWSPDLRYEPGPGDPDEAREFMRAVRTVVVWADERM